MLKLKNKRISYFLTYFDFAKEDPRHLKCALAQKKYNYMNYCLLSESLISSVI